MSRPPNLRHAVLHLQSYLGEVAKIAEMLDPDDGQIEQDRAVAAARTHVGKRFRQRGLEPCHWDACLDVVENALRDLANSSADTFFPMKPGGTDAAGSDDGRST